MRIIAGEARGRRLAAPRGLETRPALDRVRESVFSILGAGAVEDRAALDLYAGSGAFGLEAVSRGARLVTFVENGRGALRALERNIAELGFSGRARVIRGDALRQPPPGSRFDLIFVDPPFALFEAPGAAGAVLERVESLLAEALEPGGTLVLRHPSGSAVQIGTPADDRRAFGASVVLFFRRR